MITLTFLYISDFLKRCYYVTAANAQDRSAY